MTVYPSGLLDRRQIPLACRSGFADIVGDIDREKIAGIYKLVYIAKIDMVGIAEIIPVAYLYT